MILHTNLIQQVDALLPQTQCGLCGHRDGCLPYAQSIVAGEAANKCIPGGQPVADGLAHLLNRPTLVADQSVWPLQSDGRPQRMKAVIREDECIGCTKCISACPVDAILGSAKLMHSILTDLCTGCELCIAPCPVDCIDLIEDRQSIPSEPQRVLEQDDLRSRYYAHIQREDSRRLTRKAPVVRAEIDRQLFAQFSQHEQHLASIPVRATTEALSMPIDAKSTIELAKIRSQLKKLQKQLAVRPDPIKQQQLIELEKQLNDIQGT